MIGGDPHAFLDRLYSCQDTVFIYRGIKYWFQGYMPSDHSVHMEIFQCQPPGDHNLWEYNGDTISGGLRAFIKAPLFDGKAFWDAEDGIQWVDD